MPTYECPTCRTKTTCTRPDEVPYRPFCSERCKLIDLGRWLNEDYRVSEEVPEEPEIGLRDSGPDDLSGD